MICGPRCTELALVGPAHAETDIRIGPGGYVARLSVYRYISMYEGAHLWSRAVGDSLGSFPTLLALPSLPFHPSRHRPAASAASLLRSSAQVAGFSRTRASAGVRTPRPGESRLVSYGFGCRSMVLGLGFRGLWRRHG